MKTYIPYKWEIWLKKMFVIWKINSSSKLNLTIAQDPSIIFSIIQKTWQIKFGKLYKKLSTTKFNFMSNFLLIQYLTFFISILQILSFLAILTFQISIGTPPVSHQFCDLIFDSGLSQLINCPTHIHGNILLCN